MESYFKTCVFLHEKIEKTVKYIWNNKISVPYICLTYMVSKIVSRLPVKPQKVHMGFSPIICEEQNQKPSLPLHLPVQRIHAACFDEGFIYEKQLHVLLTFLCLHLFWKHFLPTVGYYSCQGFLLWWTFW